MGFGTSQGDYRTERPTIVKPADMSIWPARPRRRRWVGVLIARFGWRVAGIADRIVRVGERLGG